MKKKCNESPSCRYIAMMRSPPSDDVFPDAGLIKRARQGEEAACSELVARHLAPVRAFVAMRLPIGHVVDEITRETFVFAFTHLAEFELRELFRAWLRSIAFNLVRRELLRFAIRTPTVGEQKIDSSVATPPGRGSMWPSPSPATPGASTWSARKSG